MENILAIVLIASIIFVCSAVAIVNLVHRYRRRRDSAFSPERLEALKKQGIITEEEFERHKTQQPSIESCAISAEEMREAIDAALKPFNDLERDTNYTGSLKWAEVFGIHSDLDLSLKEVTLLSMRMGKSREVIDVIAEVLAINVPIDAIEAAQNRGKAALPNYKVIARVIWVKARELLSEPLSVQKEAYEGRKPSDQTLLAQLVPAIVRALNIPAPAFGFAVILALVIAKMEFNAFSDEENSPKPIP